MAQKILFEKDIAAVVYACVGMSSFCFEKERKLDEEENERGRDRERRLRATNPKSSFEDRPVVYPANVFDSRLRGD